MPTTCSAQPAQSAWCLCHVHGTPLLHSCMCQRGLQGLCERGCGPLSAPNSVCLCSYLCVTFIQEQSLLNSVVWVKPFVYVRALRPVPFLQSGTYKAPPICFQSVSLFSSSNDFTRWLPSVSQKKPTSGWQLVQRRTQPLVMCVLKRCEILAEAGMYSKAATILFGTSRGAAPIQGAASDRVNLVCPCVLSDLCDGSFDPGPVCC